MIGHLITGLIFHLLIHINDCLDTDATEVIRIAVARKLQLNISYVELLSGGREYDGKQRAVPVHVYSI